MLVSLGPIRVASLVGGQNTDRGSGRHKSKKQGEEEYKKATQIC